MRLIEDVYRDLRQWQIWEKKPSFILISDHLERHFMEFAHSSAGRSAVSLYSARNMRQPTLFNVPVIFCDLNDHRAGVEFKIVSDNPAPRDREWRGVQNVVWAEDVPAYSKEIK